MATMPAIVTSAGVLRAAEGCHCHAMRSLILPAMPPRMDGAEAKVTDLAAPPEGRRANAAPGAQPRELPVQPRPHTVNPARPSLRDDMEAQHQRRSDAHRRRLDVEHRMAMYQSNSITISGRPYDSLPVVSLTELRNELDGNRRGLLSGPAMSSYLN